MPERFARVDDNLFRGGRPSEEDLRALKEKLGVQRIVSLDGDVASEIHSQCNLLNLEHVVLPINGEFPNENIDKLSKFIQNLSGPKKTYIHCYYGKDRTGMACAMYRILNGVNPLKALKEAVDFGMGTNMPQESAGMYYDAVIDFAMKNDSNSAEDAAEVSRSETAMNDIAPAINDYSISNPNQMSFAPYSNPKTDTTSPVMNVSASLQLYVLSTPSQVLMPQQWFTRAEILRHLPAKNGYKLYSADVESSANIIRYPRNYNRTLLQAAKLDGADVVFFAQNVIFILNPSALINIREEDGGDSNLVGDIPQVGMKSNYDGLAPYSFPGSGGFMESGYGGFAAPVQLPLESF